MPTSRKTVSPFASVMHFAGSAAFGLSLAVALGTLQDPGQIRAAIPAAMVRSAVSVAYIPAPQSDRQARRETAKRMWKAVAQRSELLRRTVTATYLRPDGAVAGTWNVAVAEYPEWVRYDLDAAKPTAKIDEDAIAKSIVEGQLIRLPQAVDCELSNLRTDDQGVLRADTSCLAQSGYRYDAKAIAKALKQALDAKATETALAVEPVAGRIVDAGKLGIGDVSMISTGVSNFKGSGEGRKNNVRKAIGQQVNNVVVPAGAEFSFNDVLGGPVTLSRGWSMALTIFDGSRLEMAPGGGVCQASTTVYRAALKAGLPIVEHKSHSLYVSYYEAYGVGQDATIFPGKQDLRFLNDTGSPLVLQSFYEGDDAYVNILGRPDGRSVTIDGPFFGATAPAGLLVNGRAVRNNEIVWTRTVTRADGTVSDEIMVSRYNAVPKSLVAKWPAAAETIVHAAAPELLVEELR